MQKNIGRTILTVPVLATLLALTACGDRIENTEMPQPDQPSVEINRRGTEGATRDTAAADSHRGATAIMGGIGNGAAEGGPALDARLATDVRQALKRDAVLGAMKIDVSSQDALVTLSGTAPDAAASDRATQIAREVKDVKSVENQLTVG